MLIPPSILHLLPERHAFPEVIYPKFTVATQTSQTPLGDSNMHYIHEDMRALNRKDGK